MAGVDLPLRQGHHRRRKIWEVALSASSLAAKTGPLVFPSPPNQGRNTTQAAPECRTFRLYVEGPMRVTHLPRPLHNRSCWRTETRTTRQLPTGIFLLFCHLPPSLVSRLSSLLSSLSYHLPPFFNLRSPLPALSNSPIGTPGRESLPFTSNFASDS